MSGKAPWGLKLEPTVIDGIRTKMMVDDPEQVDYMKLAFDMFSDPQTSLGDITRYCAENNITIDGKELQRPSLSLILRNPVYVKADLDVYEFFKSQGAEIVNDAADFTGTNGCYLFKGRDVKESKYNTFKDHILVLAPHEGQISSETWLTCRKKLMDNTGFGGVHKKAKNTWLAGKIKCGRCGTALLAMNSPGGFKYFRCRKRIDSKACDGCGTIHVREF